MFRVILHKVAGWNVLRAAASAKLRVWVKTQVAQTLKGGESGPIVRLFALIMGLWDAFPLVLGVPHGRSRGFAVLTRRFTKNSDCSHTQDPVGNDKFDILP